MASKVVVRRHQCITRTDSFTWTAEELQRYKPFKHAFRNYSHIFQWYSCQVSRYVLREIQCNANRSRVNWWYRVCFAWMISGSDNILSDLNTKSVSYSLTDEYLGSFACQSRLNDRQRRVASHKHDGYILADICAKIVVISAKWIQHFPVAAIVLFCIEMRSSQTITHAMLHAIGTLVLVCKRP